MTENLKRTALAIVGALIVYWLAVRVGRRLVLRVSSRGEEILGVNKLEDSGIQLRARLTTVADQRWSVRREAYRRIKNRFDVEGISIPFPQITIHRAD